MLARAGQPDVFRGAALNATTDMVLARLHLSIGSAPRCHLGQYRLGTAFGTKLRLEDKDIKA